MSLTAEVIAAVREPGSGTSPEVCAIGASAHKMVSVL
jgi:hypothetical protein